MSFHFFKCECILSNAHKSEKRWETHFIWYFIICADLQGKPFVSVTMIRFVVFCLNIKSKYSTHVWFLCCSTILSLTLSNYFEYQCFPFLLPTYVWVESIKFVTLSFIHINSNHQSFYFLFRAKLMCVPLFTLILIKACIAIKLLFISGIQHCSGGIWSCPS